MAEVKHPTPKELEERHWKWVWDDEDVRLLTKEQAAKITKK